MHPTANGPDETASFPGTAHAPGTAPGSPDELLLARRLLRDGRAEQALVVADRIIGSGRAGAGPTGRIRYADALALRLAALINLRRTAEYAATVDAAFEAARSDADPALRGLLHALSALVAHHQGSLEQCVTHLVRGTRTLGTIELTDAGTVRGWHNLAIAYSYTGFHAQAASAIQRAREIAAAIGTPSVNLAAPSLRLRLAVSLDQRGDTEACSRILRDIAYDLSARRRAGELDAIRPINRRAYGYALARLAALGHRTGVDDVTLRALLAAPDDSASARDMGTLGAVCLAIAGGRPVEAAARLETVEVSEETFGPAEIERLRALAHLGSGDYASAYRADRQAFREATVGVDRLRNLLVDGVAARLDHEDVRRSAARYAAEELNDPLTGLPNRRHARQYVEQMLARGERVVLGLCELAALGDVNATHGRHSGDMVLQRVAGVLHRVMRRGDFVARYAGDRFVVVLPATSAPEASEIARRIGDAVATEEWGALVPGTTVRVTVAWAGLTARTTVTRTVTRDTAVTGDAEAAGEVDATGDGAGNGDHPFGSASDAFEAADRAVARARDRASAPVRAGSSSWAVTPSGVGR